MKKGKFLMVLPLIVILCVANVACQKETMLLTYDPNAKVSTEVIGVNSAMVIVDSLISISSNLDEELSRGTALDQQEVTIQKEREIAAVLQPLTDCGKKLRSDLLIAANDPNSGFVLSSEELQILYNIKDEELAHMMIIVLTASDDYVLLTDDAGMKISTGKAKDCLWEAFGINDAIAIWTTMAKGQGIKIAQLLTIPKGKLFKLLSKIVGKANYVMLAYTIAEFAYCMLSDDAYKVSVTEGREGLDIQKIEMAEIFESEVFKSPVILEITND